MQPAPMGEARKRPSCRRSAFVGSLCSPRRPKQLRRLPSPSPSCFLLAAITCDNSGLASRRKCLRVGTMVELPLGTVTFLFTDIEGSTARWERDREAMAAAVERHLALLDAAIQAHGGVHFKTIGDAVQAAFPAAPAAVAAACDAQRALLAEDWGRSARSGCGWRCTPGEAEPDARGDYLAAPLNRLSRLLSAGHGGQILLSQTVQQLSRGALPAGAEPARSGRPPAARPARAGAGLPAPPPGSPRDFPRSKRLLGRPNNLPANRHPSSAGSGSSARLRTSSAARMSTW